MRVFQRLLLAAWLCGVCASSEAATLTITTAGPNTGAVGVMGGGTGFVCNPFTPGGGTCTFTIPDHTSLRLAANSPATPGVFSGGTGSASVCGPYSTCAFTIEMDSSIIATFSPGSYPSVQIALGGDGRGQVGADNNMCQNFELGFSACAVYYAAGSLVTLEGRSMPGNIFANFSGGANDAAGCGSTPCVFTLTANSSVTANFARLTSVTVEPPSATINVGQLQGFSGMGTFSNSATRSLMSGFGSWTTRRSMGATRFALGVGVVNQRLYAVGGGSGGAPTSSVEMYNPAEPPFGISDSWTPRASMSIAREGVGVAVVGSRLYAIGGHTSGGGVVSSMEAYNPSTNTWDSSLPAMPTPRAEFATAAIGSVIYVVGGEDDSHVSLNTLEAYDVGANSWSTVAPMPTARRFFAAAVVNGILYAIGGTPSGTVEAYDPSTNTWSTKAPLPNPRSGLAAGAIDGLIYAVGGQQATSTGTVDVYNPATDTWTTLASMPTARTEVAGAAFDGRFFAVGGFTSFDPSTQLSTVEAFRPPETTWWSSNVSVASINPNATATGLSAGMSIIDARASGIDCATTNTCATLTVTGDGGGGGGGGGEECAQVTFTLLPGSLAFTEVETSLIDPSTGTTIETFPLPIGETLGVPAGSYHLRFRAPAGYEVTPAQHGLNVSCGDQKTVQLRFRPSPPGKAK
jgi:N-acetylneuraminic acid mutarotase